MVAFLDKDDKSTNSDIPDALIIPATPDDYYTFMDSPGRLSVSTILESKDIDRSSIETSVMDDRSFTPPSTPDSSFTYLESPEQLTVSTILDLTKDMDMSSIGTNGTQVESLPNGDPYPVKPKDKHISDDSYDLLKQEKWYTIALQVSIPFMIAGIGTIGAGLVLGTVEAYEVFQTVGALYVIIPSIIGLKGNLDTCLASRLSTQANLGNMKKKGELLKMVIGNIGVVQVQAVVAATIASIFAVCVSAVGKSESIEFNDILLVSSASILTSTLSCFVLDFLLTAVIVITHKLKLNPDNLAAPLAASIGDIVSLTVLSVFARTLYTIHDRYNWVFFLILGVYLFIILPFWVLAVRNNEYTKGVLTHGWVPVLSALFISGLGGLVLERAVGEHSGFAVFQPIINGVGGNLVSIQSSRISTMLHQTSIPGLIPPHTKHWVSPWSALVNGVWSAKSARILILLSIPGQIVFVFVADVIYNQGISAVTPAFLIAYLTVGLVQIMTLLYIAHLLCHTMWKFKLDPDNSTIPYLTAIGDLGGSSLLLLAFTILRAIGYKYTPSD